MSRICVIRLVALGLLTPVGFHFFALEGALWAIVLSHFSTLPTTIAFVVRHRLFDLRRELPLPVALLAGLALGHVF
jgi:hypothetical protein